MKKQLVGLLVGMLLFATIFSVAGTGTRNETGFSEAAQSTTTVDWWPMFRHDSSHAGFSTSPAPETNDTLWTFTTNASIRTAPAITDGKVYFGSDDKNIYCLNAVNGQKIWNYTTGNVVLSSPAITNNRVYIGSSDRNMYCLDATTGDLIWNYSTNVGVLSAPTIVNNKVYFATLSRIYCLDAIGNSNGTTNLLWSHTLSTAGSVTVVNNRVYVAATNGVVHCLDATGNSVTHTTTTLWTYTIPSATIGASTPTVLNNRVYVGSDQGVICLDATGSGGTTTRIWYYVNGSKKNFKDSSPAIANGRIYIHGSDNGKIYCINATASGTMPIKFWDAPLSSALGISCVLADDKIYINTVSTIIYCLSINNGAKIWEYTTGTGIGYLKTDPAVADGKVIMGRGNGILYCFREQHPPETPAAPQGPTQGYTNTAYTYTTSCADPDNDPLLYKWNFGDQETEWLGPYNSSAQVTQQYTWTTPGTYNVTVKTKDPYYNESSWSEPLTVTIDEFALEIGDITGGLLKVSAEIYNAGENPINNVNWNIEVTGEIFGRINTTANGTIATLNGASSEVVDNKPIYGFGKITVTVTAQLEESPIVTKTAEGFVLFVFVLIQ